MTIMLVVTEETVLAVVGMRAVGMGMMVTLQGVALAMEPCLASASSVDNLATGLVIVLKMLGILLVHATSVAKWDTGRKTARFAIGASRAGTRHAIAPKRSLFQLEFTRALGCHLD